MSKNTGSLLNLHLFIVLQDHDDSVQVVECWDENCIDGNEEGWVEAKRKAKAMYGTELQYREVIVVTRGLPELFDIPEVEGAIVEE